MRVKLKQVSGLRFLLCMATATSLPAQTIISFNGNDGSNPPSAPVQAANGALYGVASGLGVYGEGSIYKITRTGLMTLYSFCPESGCPDGGIPVGGLVQAANGDLYGTTQGYQTLMNPLDANIFKITPSGSFATVHYLDPTTEGAGIAGTLIQAANGDLYGTASEGGTHNGGTVFKVTPAGMFTVLYNFCSRTGCTDGYKPSGGLVQGPSGDLYGTTYNGGSTQVTHGSGMGFGTIFRITPAGNLTTLYRFCLQVDCPDGSGPLGSLVQAADGNFYGVTQTGGNAGNGTVFKITPGGALTTLYRFSLPEGELPNTLIQGSDGNLYGTTGFGGAGDYGTVFQITLDGTLTSLFNGTPGTGLLNGLGQDTNGDFLVSAQAGGTYGDGTIVILNEGLGPFVNTLPAFGEAGSAIRILGTGLMGATSVTFNGAVAVFDVVSDSEITTTVPAGATSGTVQVVTPGGPLSSNAPFWLR
jgi:uncharacterized repeat protein (TIGR03803 family)